ncbi:hypothetical protein Lser_V15G33134 [Lactuca serriola]
MKSDTEQGVIKTLQKDLHYPFYNIQGKGDFLFLSRPYVILLSSFCNRIPLEIDQLVEKLVIFTSTYDQSMEFEKEKICAKVKYVRKQDRVGPFMSGTVYRSQLDRRMILLDEDFMAKLSGYDITKLIHGPYPAKIQCPHNLYIGDYYPGCTSSCLPYITSPQSVLAVIQLDIYLSNHRSHSQSPWNYRTISRVLKWYLRSC